MTEHQRKVVKLLETSGARLHGLLARLTLREDIVGDLMQELFTRLLQSKGFEKAADPFAYAYRAAINLAFEWRRKPNVRFESLSEDCLSAANPTSTLGTMIQAEKLQQVLDATGRLSSLARDVVVMHYIQQEPYEEIGRRLGKKPQHLRSVAAKALARLRTSLAITESNAGGKE